MTEIVYLQRLDDLGAKTVQSIGTQPGPPGGDGWQVVSQVPTSRLQAGRHYAILVTFKVGNIQVFGSPPSVPNANGVLQVCLGDAAGARHPAFLLEHTLFDPLGPGQGIGPFAFLLLFSASPFVSDVVWGNTWPNASNLQLLARAYWNGDPTSYGAWFEVNDVQWIWADLDAIPPSDQLVTRVVSPTLIPQGAFSTMALGANTPGAVGQKWAHWAVASYRPGRFPTAPQFQFGRRSSIGSAGWSPRVGNGGLGVGFHGRQTVASSRYRCYHHILGFWVEEQDAAIYLPELRGRDVTQVPGDASVFERFDVLSIRLDDLSMVDDRSATEEANLSDWVGNGALSRFFPHEVGATGRVGQPWIFAAGVVGHGSRRAHGIWIDTNSFAQPYADQLYPVCNAPTEAVQLYGSSALGLGPSSADIQYRHRWLELAAAQGSPWPVRSLYALQVWPIKDPDNIILVPAVVGNPVAIVPGKEGLAVGSLPDPPLAPNAAIAEEAVASRHEMVGATGYKRTWGTFVAQRRLFQLSWGPLSEAQRDLVWDFLRNQLAFRIRPPRETSQVPVVRIGPPAVRQVSGQTFAVEVQVAELIYTGA